MRWPWRRHGRPSEAAERAVEVAREHLREAERLRPEARRVADSLRELRERNHFTAAIDAVFKERR